MVHDGVYEEYVSYYSDGWLYTQPFNKIGWEKTRAYVDKNDHISDTTLSPAPFYLLNNITKTAAANDTIYTINYSTEAFNAILATELSDLADSLDPGTLNTKTLQEVTIIGADGKLKSQTITNSMSASLTDNGIVYPVSIDISAKIRVMETGDSVTINLPSTLPK